MTALLEGGRIIDVILLLMLAEWVVLAIVWKLTKRAVAPLDLAINLMSGAMLLVALRGALTGADRLFIVTALLAAFAAHLLDLWRRWPRRR